MSTPETPPAKSANQQPKQSDAPEQQGVPEARDVPAVSGEPAASGVPSNPESSERQGSRWLAVLSLLIASSITAGIILVVNNVRADTAPAAEASGETTRATGTEDSTESEANSARWLGPAPDAVPAASNADQCDLTGAQQSIDSENSTVIGDYPWLVTVVGCTESYAMIYPSAAYNVMFADVWPSRVFLYAERVDEGWIIPEQDGIAPVDAAQLVADAQVDEAPEAEAPADAELQPDAEQPEEAQPDAAEAPDTAEQPATDLNYGEYMDEQLALVGIPVELRADLLGGQPIPGTEPTDSLYAKPVPSETVQSPDGRFELSLPEGWSLSSTDDASPTVVLSESDEPIFSMGFSSSLPNECTPLDSTPLDTATGGTATGGTATGGTATDATPGTGTPSTGVPGTGTPSAATPSTGEPSSEREVTSLIDAPTVLSTDPALADSETDAESDAESGTDTVTASASFRMFTSAPFYASFGLTTTGEFGDDPTCAIAMTVPLGEENAWAASSPLVLSDSPTTTTLELDSVSAAQRYLRSDDFAQILDVLLTIRLSDASEASTATPSDESP